MSHSFNKSDGSNIEVTSAMKNKSNPRTGDDLIQKQNKNLLEN